MRLTVVGASGSFPGPEGSASCYLVEIEDGDGVFRVLLDLGSGSLGPLQRFTDIYRVDAILISHLHADHCLDLCGLYVARRYRPGGPAPRIPVYGPEGAAQRLAFAYDLPTDPGMSEEFDFRCYPDGSFRLGPLTVSTARMVHPVPCYAVRLEANGRSLTYSGDTAPTQGLVELARGTDLLLAEASFVDGEDNPADLHMTGREAGLTATEAGAGRLVVTHVPPWHSVEVALDEARAAYSGHVVAAVPGESHLV